ncbi:MAG TPA: sialidase family protein [Kofleriaceae bacterium]
MRRALAAALAIVVGCGGGDDDGPGERSPDAAGGGQSDAAAEPAFAPGEAMTLTIANPAEDEDPSVLRAADGMMVVAWFGRVDGNADLFLASTRDGATWTGPVRITTSPDDDFAPHLIQTSDGWFHLTWFRREPGPTYFARVRHSRTMDLAAWQPDDEIDVADADPIEDWVPTIAERPDGDLQIVLVSRIRDESGPHDLYTATSDDGGETWSEVAPLAALNDAAEQDHLPYLARTGAELTLVWNRCDADPATPWTNPTSDVLASTSSDGDSWSAPRPITADDDGGVLDVFPALFADHADTWSLVWVTTALEPTGTVVALPLDGAYPDERAALPMTGYSPRVAATPTDGVFLGAWVEGEIGEQNIRARFFSRD